MNKFLARKSTMIALLLIAAMGFSMAGYGIYLRGKDAGRAEHTTPQS